MDELDELLKQYALKFHRGAPIFNYKQEELEKVVKQAIESGQPLNPPEPKDKGIFY